MDLTMSDGNGHLRFGTRWSRKEARHHVAAAFRHAVRSVRASQASVARWCGRSERTVRYWLAGTKPLEIESVLQSPRLRRHFLRCLGAIERKAKG